MSSFLHHSGLFIRQPGGLVELTRIAEQAVSGNTALPYPTTQAGDLIIYGLFQASELGENTYAPVTPAAGWTELLDNGFLGSYGVGLFVRVADGSETGNITFGMGASGGGQRRLVVLLRGNRPIISVSGPQDPTYQETSSNPSAQTCNASGGTAPVLVLGQYAALSAVSPRTFTIGGVASKDDEYNSGTTFYVAWKFFGSGVSPSDCVIDMDDEGFNALGSTYINLTI